MADYSSDDDINVNWAIFIVGGVALIILERNAARIVRFFNEVKQNIEDLFVTFMSFSGHLLLWIAGIAAALAVFALIFWAVSAAARETYSRFKRVPEYERELETIKRSINRVEMTSEVIDGRFEKQWRHIAVLQEKLKSLEANTVDDKKVDSVAADILGVSHDAK